MRSLFLLLGRWSICFSKQYLTGIEAVMKDMQLPLNGGCTQSGFSPECVRVTLKLKTCLYNDLIRKRGLESS